MDRPQAGEQSRRARRVDEAAGDPLGEAVRTYQQLADSVPEAVAARLLLQLALPCLVLEARERRTDKARDLVLGDQAADPVGGDSGEHEILRAQSLGELAGHWFHLSAVTLR